MKQDFGIRKPKIAVLGLNPHAGDQGVLGNEEDNIINPALQKAKEENIFSFGPYPADSFFGSDKLGAFDGILAMYHDQGLIPFKTLAFGKGVNFTSGLPFVRTSPDHGTAFEIAGEKKRMNTLLERLFLLLVTSTKSAKSLTKLMRIHFL